MTTAEKVIKNKLGLLELIRICIYCDLFLFIEILNQNENFIFFVDSYNFIKFVTLFRRRPLGLL